MGESSSATTSVEEEERLFAALEQIIVALESKKNLGDESRKIFADFGARLMNIGKSSDSRAVDGTEEEDDDDNEGFHEIDHRLNRIQEKITSFEKQSLIWDSGPEEAYDFLNDIEEAHRLMKTLESRDSDECDLFDLSSDVLYRGMARLEEEFWCLLVQKPQACEHEPTSFRSTEDQQAGEGSILSSGNDTSEYVVQGYSAGGASEEYATELVPPDVIPFLRAIAKLMFDSNHGHECSHVYTVVRKDALDEYLCTLEMEKRSIEDVLRMEWEDLEPEIMKWNWAIRDFVEVQLVAEKSLADQIFGDIGSVSNASFFDSSKTSILALLNFCEAISITPYRPEKLIRVLMMYEALADVVPKLESLFSFDAGSGIKTECRYVLGRLGDYSRSIFLEFRKAVSSSSSENIKVGGGVHGLTSYVMNYLKVLTDSRSSFDEVMKGLYNESVDPDTGTQHRNGDHADDSSEISPTEEHFRSIITILESNLEEISKLYRDESIRHIFLMNNIHYIAEKSKSPELMAVLGEGWIRKRIQKVHDHAREYQKCAWSSILSFLGNEGINYPFSNSDSTNILKERLRCFYLTFEEVYRNQTGWIIPDIALRDDVLIWISLTVIQAYRSFVGRYGGFISEKHIKYTADDLESLLLDLFAGSHKSLHGGSRR